jgi:hypothetical protein
MRQRILTGIAVLAVGTALAATAAFAQSSARSLNDGGFSTQQPVTSYPPTGGGQQEINRTSGGSSAMAGEAGNCAARFHSFDPSSGTYMGFDGKRHSCP